MTPKVLANPRWSTASFGHPPDTSPMELSALGEHFAHCNGARGRWFTLRCIADATRSLMAGRVVTTALLLSLLIGFSWWLI